MEPNAKLLDVMYAVRSDESTHRCVYSGTSHCHQGSRSFSTTRFVNHTLANLNVKNDVNPFAIREPNMHVKGVKPGCVVFFDLVDVISSAHSD
jgi:ubiquinol oxidase